MRKKVFTFMAIACIGLSLFCSCGDSGSSESSEQDEKNETYFAIVDEINNADYDAAESDIEENYGEYEYSLEADGTNKMNLYRLLYDKQEKYDDEMDVLLEYLKSFDFKSILEEEEVSEEQNEVKFVIKEVNEILDMVSDNKKDEAVNLIGQDILDANKDD